MPGRKPIFTEEEIKVRVEEYVKKHKDEKLVFETLYKYIGLSRATAYRQPYKGILEQEIIRYNFAPARINTRVKHYPTLSEIIEKCDDNPALLKNELLILYDLMKQMENDKTELIKALEKSLNDKKAENKELHSEKNKLQREFDALLDKYNYLVIGKDSMIRLNDNIEKTKKSSFEEQFKELFGND